MSYQLSSVDDRGPGFKLAPWLSSIYQHRYTLESWQGISCSCVVGLLQKHRVPCDAKPLHRVVAWHRAAAGLLLQKRISGCGSSACSPDQVPAGWISEPGSPFLGSSPVPCSSALSCIPLCCESMSNPLYMPVLLVTLL